MMRMIIVLQTGMIVIVFVMVQVKYLHTGLMLMAMTLVLVSLLTSVAQSLKTAGY